MAKLITLSENLLKDILPYVKNTPLEKKIKNLLENTNKYQTQNISYFPKRGKVERVVDGDTIVLNNGSIVRYVGITAPENNEPFEKESTEANRKLVESKSVPTRITPISHTSSTPNYRKRGEVPDKITTAIS